MKLCTFIRIEEGGAERFDFEWPTEKPSLHCPTDPSVIAELERIGTCISTAEPGDLIECMQGWVFIRNLRVQ